MRRNCLRARRRSVESIQNQRDYGEVQTVSATLDREAATSHTLTVRASDKGSPTSLSSTATVTVTVQDVNDNDTQRDDICFFLPSLIARSIQWTRICFETRRAP